MEFDKLFSPEEIHSDGLQERQAMRLLTSLESRTAYLVAEVRRAVELILNSEAKPMVGSDSFQQRRQKATSNMTVDELERYAPQWASLIPPNPKVQAAVSHLLGQKYALIYDAVPNIRQALGLDKLAVKQAYESQYGQPLESIFKINMASYDATERKKKQAAEEEQDRYEIESLLSWVYLSTDDILFEQGDIGNSLYVIMHGRLRVIVEAGGVREIVREVGSGEIIGEMALITGEPRSATLQAVRDTRLVKLSKASFERLIERHPQVMMQIARIQSKRVRLLSVRPPHSTTLVTLAVIPTSKDVPLADFCQRLVGSLSTHGSCLHLNRQRLEREMQMSALWDNENDSMIVAWLSEQEMNYRFIIYESDSSPSPWTRRCLRQADHILIVGQANSNPELGEIELEMGRMSNVRKKIILLHQNYIKRPVGTNKWLTPRQVERHYHLRWNIEGDFDRIARLLTGNGVGLVLSGGGATGLAHIGVIRALEETGIPIDMVGGTSQGSWISGMYAMGYDYDTMMSVGKEVMSKVGRLKYTLPMVSLLTGHSATKAIKMLFGEQFIEDLWLNYFCVSANLTHGKMMVHESGSLWKYVRASSAIPGIVPPLVDNNNDLLIDGVTVNNLPTDVMRRHIENGTVFASNIMPYFEKVASLSKKEQYGGTLSGWRVLWRRLNPFTKSMNVPSIADIIWLSMQLSNRNTLDKRGKMSDFQFDLDVRPYGFLDYDAFDTLVEIGYRSAQEKIAEWKKNGQWMCKE